LRGGGAEFLEEGVHCAGGGGGGGGVGGGGGSRGVGEGGVDLFAAHGGFVAAVLVFEGDVLFAGFLWVRC
jgi:hypothetical protein